MHLIVDAHEDLAWNALSFGRDYTRSALETRQAELKGDAPIIGQDIFLNLTLEDFAQFETRRLPSPSGVSAARPNSSEFFGRGEQLFYANDFSLGIDLFHVHIEEMIIGHRCDIQHGGGHDDRYSDH